MGKVIDRRGLKIGKIVVLDQGTPEREGTSKHYRILYTCKCLVCGGIFTLKDPYWGRKGFLADGCQKCYLKTKLKEKGYAGLTEVFHGYIRRCKKLGREFSLTREQFHQIMQQNCTYCGKPPSCVMKSVSGNGNGDYVYNTIDRVDSSLGYTLDNSVPCCRQCNLMKRDMEVEEFMLRIKRIYSHNKDKITSLKEEDTSA